MIPTILQSKNRSQSGMNAPACGLTLHRVYYH
jgi:tRNA U38,U39,U40 pseudouridine synthase TruA